MVSTKEINPGLQSTASLPWPKRRQTYERAGSARLTANTKPLILASTFMKKLSRKVRAKKTRKTRVPPAVRAWAARNGHKGGKAVSKRKSQSSAINLEKAREKRWPTHFTD